MQRGLLECYFWIRQGWWFTETECMAKPALLNRITSKAALEQANFAGYSH